MSEGETKRGETGEPGAESSGSFRVIDRRRFAADGTERAEPETVESGKIESEAGSARRTDDHAEPGRRVEKPSASGAGSTTVGRATAHLGTDFVMSDADRGPAEAQPDPTLSTLLLSLSTQALMHLGEIPDPATGRPERDLEAARGIIDLLGVLEQKTTGNLDAAEAALLERILYDLRMRFVELARASA